MVRKCCVPSCNSGVNVPLHKFPKNPERCLKWIKSLNLHYWEDYCANQLQKHKVCHKDFREEDYSGSLHHRFLSNTAIPIPFITDNDINIIASNSEQQISQQQRTLQEHESIKQLNEILRNQSVFTEKIVHLEKQIQQHSKQLSQ